MIPSGIEPATFQFLAQYRNQLRYRVPPQIPVSMGFYYALNKDRLHLIIGKLVY
jgi:hypothetical protein